MNSSQLPTLTSKNLKKKAFASYRSILNAAFKLAYEESWIKDNVYSRINFKKYIGMLAENTPIEERIHSEDDVKRILDYPRDYHIKKPSYIPAYALEMQMAGHADPATTDHYKRVSRLGDIDATSWNEMFG